MDYIKDLLKKSNIYVFPDIWTPLFQILTATLSGLFFGAFNKALVMTLISFLFFESMYLFATADREYLYNWKYRIISILCAFLAILFSKCVWGNYPLSQFFIPND